MASSKRRYPRVCRARMGKATTAVMSPAVNSGTPKSRLRAIAAPTNSARSVAAEGSSVDLHPRRARELAAEGLHVAVVEAHLERAPERLAVDHLEADVGADRALAR